MKVSVSLPETDVAYLDDYARRLGQPSRSAALHRAIDLLRLSEMEDAYAMAFHEWNGAEDAHLWDGTSGDGLADAAR